ncbi:MAG: hypothetical protein QOD99_284, partial [Chthoniobacter sp.]|nr:hypothetical protein [Chthoniobacter sp.]
MFKQLMVAALCVAVGEVHAQDGALLDLLVKKKIVTAQEAEDVRADLVKEQVSTSSGKIAVGSWVKEMKIGGDLRMRYQYDSRDFQVDPPEVGSHSVGTPHDKDRSPNGAQRSMWRFRLRLYDEFKLADNWFGGVGLATTPLADGANQTLGSGFGKYGIFISKAYLGWKATDWATIIVGKQANPFYTTDLVWDPDINPDGLVTTFSISKLFAGLPQGGFSKDGFSKDGKAVVAAKPAELPWDLSLNLGAFIFADNSENGGATEPGLRDNDFSTDSYLFQGQLVGS